MACWRKKSMESAKELGEAIKRGDDYIEVECDLAKKVFKLKATGKAAWAVCIADISVAVAGAVAAVGTVGPASAPAAVISTPAMTSTVAILGAPTAIMALSVALAGGGVGVLNHLMKDYDIEKISDEKLILHRKKNEKR